MTAAAAEEAEACVMVVKLVDHLQQAAESSQIFGSPVRLLAADLEAQDCPPEELFGDSEGL